VANKGPFLSLCEQVKSTWLKFLVVVVNFAVNVDIVIIIIIKLLCFHYLHLLCYNGIIFLKYIIIFII
jgi:hypothetical protein